MIKNNNIKKGKMDEVIEAEIIDEKKMTYKIIAKFLKEIKFNIPDTNTFLIYPMK